MTGVYWLALIFIVSAVYITWTAGRLDRMHARVDAAWAALDAQLVRRAAAARALVPYLPSGPEGRRLQEAADHALAVGHDDRERVENDLSRALHPAVVLLPVTEATAAVRAELETAVSRVGLARSFHNSAVQTSLALRRRRMPRLLHLAGHRALPEFFDMDDGA